MRLSDQDIERKIESGDLAIDPIPSQSSINGVTVDIRLGNSFRVANNHEVSYINLSEDKVKLNGSLNNFMSEEIFIDDDKDFILHPGEFVLGVTYESITIPDDLVGILDGRSSLARLGVGIHITACRIDPGWSGKIVLEFTHMGKIPVALKPKMKIGALSFEVLSSKALRPYSSRGDAKYKNQQSVLISKINED